MLFFIYLSCDNMKRVKHNFGKIYLVTFILIIVLSVIFFIIINKKTLPILVNYANVQTKRIGIEVLRNTGLKEVNKRLKNEDIFNLLKDNNGQIESINFDTVLLNEMLVVVSKAIRERLTEIENGKKLPDELYANVMNNKLKKGIVYEVPLGIASGNSFFSNLGPKIPIKVTYSGNVGLDIKTRVSEYGINSALIEIYIKAEVTQRTIAPFISSDTKLISEIPLVIKVVKGTVPNYLLGTNNSYALPNSYE